MRQPDIYSGFWRDYSHDGAKQLTLTLSAANGALLIAFLALFVALVGARSWVITTFLIHQFRAKDRPEDGLHHQSQLLLRNAGSEIPLATEYLRLNWAWGKKGVSSTRRTLPITLIALIHFILFTAAGLFSSRIALNQTGSNRALLKPYHCGAPGGATRGLDRKNSLVSYVSREARTAVNYVDTCYNGEIGSADCSVFPKSKLDFSVTTNVTCPFKPAWRCCQPLSPDQCAATTGSKGFLTERAIQFDTGKIDMLDLGYNVPPDQRLLYRKVSTCSPISWDDSETSYTGSINKFPTIYFHFGRTLLGNYTFGYDSHASVDGFGYQVEVDSAGFPPSELDQWHPIPDLYREDADAVLIFITPNSMAYVEPVNDRVFGAHIKFNTSVPSISFDAAYSSDALVSVIGCIDQYQLCDASKPERCTPLTSDKSVRSSLHTTNLNPDQISVSGSFIPYGMDTAPNALGTEALKAEDQVVGARLSATLPHNQWEIETTRWFATTLASLQRNFVSYANKYDGEVPNMKPAKDFGEIAEKQCSRQVIRVSGTHQSFSVLGMAITLSIGLVILLLSIVVEPLTNKLSQRVFHKGRVKHLQYVGDGLLQTQRSALEDNERGRWRPGRFGVPITVEPSAKFPHLFQEAPAEFVTSPSEKSNAGLSDKKFQNTFDSKE